MDWSVGRYERVAVMLRSASVAVIEHAAPGPGERVLDVGCGTGNAALLAAERGARVIGVDPAERLLDVAREAARSSGADVQFMPGTAEDLPVADGSADVIVSVFGVIFAPDAPAAVDELARVTARDGRVAISAWIPTGAIAETTRLGRQAIAQAAGTPPGPPPFAWHDRDALRAVLEPHGFSVEMHEHSIQFTAGTAEEWVDDQMDEHPVWVAGRGVLESSGELQPLRDRVLEVLRGANEDPDAFRVTSRYVVAVARRSG